MKTSKVLGKLLGRSIIQGQINQPLIGKSATQTQLCRPRSILCNSNHILSRHLNFPCGINSKEAILNRGLNLITRRNYHDDHGYCSGFRGILEKTKMALERSCNWLFANLDELVKQYVLYPSLVVGFAAIGVGFLRLLVWEPLVYGPAIFWHGRTHIIQERLKRLKAEEEEDERKCRQMKMKKKEW